MKRYMPSVALLRLTIIVAGLLVVVVGVTFALFQSNMNEIQGNTISSASAHLLIGGDGAQYSDTLPGFVFSNLEPGGPASPDEGKDVYFKNDGTAALKLGVNVATTLNNPQHVDLEKIWLVLTPADGGEATRISMATMYDSYSNGTYVPLGQVLAPSEVGHYKLRVQMDADAVTATTSNVTLDTVDWLFVGNSVTEG